jgi:hypothetical protein
VCLQGTGEKRILAEEALASAYAHFGGDCIPSFHLLTDDIGGVNPLFNAVRIRPRLQSCVHNIHLFVCLTIRHCGVLLPGTGCLRTLDLPCKLALISHYSCCLTIGLNNTAFAHARTGTFLRVARVFCIRCPCVLHMLPARVAYIAHACCIRCPCVFAATKRHSFLKTS